jgi:hypothetical protein
MNRPFTTVALFGLVILALGTGGYELTRPGVTQARTTPALAPAVVVQAPSEFKPERRDLVLLLVAGFPRPLVGVVPVAKDLNAEISESGSGQGERQLQLVLRRGDAGAVVDGASVIADGNMLSMSHDSLRVGSTALGDGTYLLVLPFTMDGQWDILLTITAGAIRGNVDLSIDVGGAS